jgi:hypothetical protein
MDSVNVSQIYAVFLKYNETFDFEDEERDAVIAYCWRAVGLRERIPVEKLIR